MRPNQRTISMIMVAVSCALATACGSATHTSAGNTSTGNTGTGNTGTGNRTTLPRATCGSVTTHGLDDPTLLLRADPGALTCFNTAARACKPASIRMQLMGVDTSNTYVFAIASGAADCTVTAMSQGYSANTQHSTAVTTTSCHLTAATASGVRLSCAGQDILIPSAMPARR